jgi:hypothetical protein
MYYQLWQITSDVSLVDFESKADITFEFCFNKIGRSNEKLDICLAHVVLSFPMAFQASYM